MTDLPQVKSIQYDPSQVPAEEGRDRTGDQIGLPVGVTFKKAMKRYTTGLGSDMANFLRPIIMKELRLNHPEFFLLWTEEEADSLGLITEIIEEELD